MEVKAGGNQPTQGHGQASLKQTPVVCSKTARKAGDASSGGAAAAEDGDSQGGGDDGGSGALPALDADADAGGGVDADPLLQQGGGGGAGAGTVSTPGVGGEGAALPTNQAPGNAKKKAAKAGKTKTKAAKKKYPPGVSNIGKIYNAVWLRCFSKTKQQVYYKYVGDDPALTGKKVKHPPKPKGQTAARIPAGPPINQPFH